MQTSLGNLLYSRKFWLMFLDIVVSLATYFTGKYLDPDSVKDILFLIGALQPAVILVITAITVQNIEGIRSEARVAAAKAYGEADSQPIPPS